MGIDTAVNSEWLNQNSLRNYPFRENTRLIPEDSLGNILTDLVLPNSLIVDFVITTPYDSAALEIYLSQVAYVGTLLTFKFVDADDESIANIAVDLGTHTVNDGYNITGVGEYEDVRGRIVIGDTSDLVNAFPQGSYYYTNGAAQMEVCTVRPDIRGIRSLQLEQGANLSERIYGHVKLLEGSNIRLTYIPEYNAIRFDAINGAGFNEVCECDDPYSDTCITSINGIAIDDVELIGDGSCIDVRVEGNRILLYDSCSEPCCGCPELEFLTQNLKILESTVSNLENYTAQLSSRMQTFVTNFVLAVQGV